MKNEDVIVKNKAIPCYDIDETKANESEFQLDTEINISKDIFEDEFSENYSCQSFPDTSFQNVEQFDTKNYEKIPNLSSNKDDCILAEAVSLSFNDPNLFENDKVFSTPVKFNSSVDPCFNLIDSLSSLNLSELKQSEDSETDLSFTPKLSLAEKLKLKYGDKLVNSLLAK